MTNNFLVGTWRLISYETRLENGQIIYLFGQNPIGYLMYSEDGYMSVNIMKANRRSFSSEDFTKITQEEKVATVETFFAYSGKYEILADKVIHYPEISMIPNWIGVKQERIFQMMGNKLSLNVPPAKLGDTLAASNLVWERVS